MTSRCSTKPQARRGVAPIRPTAIAQAGNPSDQAAQAPQAGTTSSRSCSRRKRQRGCRSHLFRRGNGERHGRTGPTVPGSRHAGCRWTFPREQLLDTARALAVALQAGLPGFHRIGNGIHPSHAAASFVAKSASGLPPGALAVMVATSSRPHVGSPCPRWIPAKPSKRHSSQGQTDARPHPGSPQDVQRHRRPDSAPHQKARLSARESNAWASFGPTG